MKHYIQRLLDSKNFNPVIRLTFSGLLMLCGAAAHSPVFLIVSGCFALIGLIRAGFQRWYIPVVVIAVLCWVAWQLAWLWPLVILSVLFLIAAGLMAVFARPILNKFER